MGRDWHPDYSYNAAPALCSVLYMVKILPVGSNTLIAALTASFEVLSSEVKQ